MAEIRHIAKGKCIVEQKQVNTFKQVHLESRAKKNGLNTMKHVYVYLSGHTFNIKAQLQLWIGNLIETRDYSIWAIWKY